MAGAIGSTSISTLQPSDTTPSIANITITLADTEQSYALPAGTKEFILKPRGLGSIKLSYTSGQSGTVYVTVKGGSVYVDSNYYSSQTIYFQSSSAGEIIELVTFS